MFGSSQMKTGKLPMVIMTEEKTFLSLILTIMPIKHFIKMQLEKLALENNPMTLSFHSGDLGFDQSVMLTSMI